ncbi:MAG: hypothetical protein WDM81_19310 [Rhizomicrobium sp.]
MKNAAWRVENKGTLVEFGTDQASGFHDFRDGTKIVVDVLAPRTDADSYRPPGDGKPTITAPDAEQAVGGVGPRKPPRSPRRRRSWPTPTSPAPQPTPPPAAPAATPPATAPIPAAPIPLRCRFRTPTDSSRAAARS